MICKSSTLSCPSTAHPLVQLLFAELRKRNMGISELAKKSGIERTTISSWRRRHTMTLVNLECCLQVLGLHLFAAEEPQKILTAAAEQARAKVILDLIVRNAEQILLLSKGKAR